MASLSTAPPPLLASNSPPDGRLSTPDSQAGSMGSNHAPNPSINGSSTKKKKKKRKGGATSASANSSYNDEHHADDSATALDYYHSTANASLPSNGNSSFADDYEEDHISSAETAKKSSKKKKKKKNAANGISAVPNEIANGSAKKTDRIWNTNTNEERERIKDFWLSLGEEERRSLVKVEKEAVLRKMKEQQKHSCSCSVCGRKRTAIEQELEVLYDAYYEELEQYANQQQYANQAPQQYGPIPPPSLRPPYPPLNGHHHHPGGLIRNLPPDEDDEDDLDDDDDYSESDQPPELLNHELPREFFNFGNSLTVQGGILTVADDLLKNDGKKFIEMMEQLAERRMAREEEALTAAEYEDDDDYDDDEEDDDYEDDEEDDEAESMSDEQRMEEGRRMFQIFAARMFEQRVLTAYREKVSQERQRKLLEELDEENRLQEERELKKAKEKEKKKDKKRQQKQAKEEDRIRRENEKAAEEAAHRAEELRKAEEARKKREEQRLKKEAERRALEEERLRKEEERRKRQQEEREREAERERKRKEKEEKERKKKEEQARKERELKDQREHELRESREKEELHRKNKLEAERKQREEQELQENLSRQQQEKELRERESKERDARARKEQQQRDVYTKRVQIQHQQLQHQQVQMQAQAQAQAHAAHAQIQQQQQSLLQQMSFQQVPPFTPPLQSANGVTKSGQLFTPHSSATLPKPSSPLHSSFPSVISPPNLPKPISSSRTSLSSAPGQAPPISHVGQRIPSAGTPSAPDSPLSTNSLLAQPHVGSSSPSQSPGQIPAQSMFNRSYGDFSQQQSPSQNPTMPGVPLGLYGNTVVPNMPGVYRPFGSALTGMNQPLRPQMMPAQSRQSFGMDYGANAQQQNGMSSYPFGGPSRTSTTPIGLSGPPPVGGISGLVAPTSVSSVLGNDSISPSSSSTPGLDRLASVGYDQPVGLPAMNGLVPSSPKSKAIQRPHPVQRPPSISRSDEPHTSSSSASDEFNISPPVMGSLALNDNDGLDDDDILYHQPTARHATVPLGAPRELSSIGVNPSSISLNPVGIGAARPLFGQSPLFNDAFSSAKRPPEVSHLYSSWMSTSSLENSNVPSTPWATGWTESMSSDHKKL